MASMKSKDLVWRSMVALVLAAGSVWAGQATWSGAADAVWSHAGNWSTGLVPGSGDNATFSGAGNGNTTLDLGAGITLGSLLFDTAGAAAFTIGTNGNQNLTLDDNGAILRNSTVTRDERITAAIALGTATASSYLFSNDGTAGTLTFAGAIAGGSGGGAGAKGLTLSGAGNTDISGVIADGGAASLTLTKTGTGTLTLTGTNGYSGPTVITAGKLTLRLTAAVGYNQSASGSVVTNTGTAGAAYNGTAVDGGMEVGTGPGGANAMVLARNDGYLRIGSAAYNSVAGYPIESGNFTASAWAYYIYADDYATLFRGGLGEHQLLINGTKLGAWDRAGFQDSGYDISALREKAEWHMLSVVGNGGANTMTYYVDGQAVGTVTGFDSKTDIGSIGANFLQQTFCQKIANASIYDRSLSADQIQQLYQDDLAAICYKLPASGSVVTNNGTATACNGTAVSGTLQSGTGPGGANALALTKYSGYLQVGPAVFNSVPGYSIASGDFTASAWAYYIYADNYATLFRGAFGHHQLLIQGTQLGAWADNTFKDSGYDISALREKSEWHMLTVVGNSSANTMTYYVDGQAVGTVTGFDSHTEIGSVGANFSQQTFSQKIGSTCIYNRSFSAAQVWQLYTRDLANLPPAPILPVATRVQIAAGATLDLGGSSQRIGSLTGSGSTDGRITTSGGPATLTLGGDNTHASFYGTIQGDLTLAKEGTGTQILGGANSYGGATVVNGGTLALELPAAAPTGTAVRYDLPASGSTVTNSGSAGAAYNGTVVVGSLEADTGPGGANVMSVTKNSGYLQVGAAAAGSVAGYSIASGNFTASAWAYYIYADDYATLFRGAYGNHQLLIHGTRLGAWDGGGFWDSGYDIGALREKAEWHMLTVVGNGEANTMTYYVDGQAVGTVAGFDSHTEIGSVGANFFQQTFCQKIARVCIYDSSLNAAQVLQLYLAHRAGSPTRVLPPATCVRIASGATLDLGGSSQQVGSLADSGGAGGAITNSGSRVTLAIGGDNTSPSFSGTLQGELSLTKVGTGTQTLTGNSTFSGEVLIQDGTLAVRGGSDVIPDTAVVEVRAGATLSVSGPEEIGALRVDRLSAGTVTQLTPKSNGILYLVNTSGRPSSWTIPLTVAGAANLNALTSWRISANGTELKGYTLGYDASASRLYLYRSGTLLTVL